MTVKEWLNRGYKIDKEINALLSEQQDALTRATSTTRRADGDKVQTTKRNSAEDRFANYAAYSELIDSKIDELYEVKQEIMTAITKLDDHTLAALLLNRYIRFMTWEQIAEEMNYSYVHIVHNLHPKALRKIKELIEFNNPSVI